MFCWLPNAFAQAASSFWQWWNQSQNAGTGYFNGAAAGGGADAVTTFAKGYGVAVSVAMVLALGAGKKATVTLSLAAWLAGSCSVFLLFCSVSLKSNTIELGQAQQ